MKGFAVCLAALCLLRPPRAAHEDHELRAGYSARSATMPVPDVTLVDMDGQRVPLSAALGDGPVLLQFIFTTCPTVCPMLSATLAGAQDRLPDVRMVSISIDPEHDTPGAPPRVRAALPAPGRQWRFLTGQPGRRRRRSESFRGLPQRQDAARALDVPARRAGSLGAAHRGGRSRTT